MVNCLVGKILELTVIIYLINCACDALGRRPRPGGAALLPSSMLLYYSVSSCLLLARRLISSLTSADQVRKLLLFATVITDSFYYYCTTTTSILFVFQSVSVPLLLTFFEQTSVLHHREPGKISDY